MSNRPIAIDSKYFPTMLDALSDMVRVVTREGRIAYTNKAYDRKFMGGLSAVGQFCYTLYGKSESCTPCITNEVMRTGTMRQVTRHLDGRVYSVTASPLKDEETGVIIGTVEVFREITLEHNIRTNLVTKNSSLQGNLHMASRVQHALVNNVLPTVEGYDLCAGFFPCEAVGGDIYDCIVADDKLVLYAADACGHGVTPAMLAVFFSRAVRAACTLGYKTPADILSYVQSEFLNLDVPSELYITGFVVVLDVHTGDFYYTNAGLSVEPIVCHDGQIEELYMASPPIAHWMPRREYENVKGHLSPSDRLLIYTDGINEVQTNEEALRQLYDLFCETDFDAENFIRKVRRDMITRVLDDVTLLICSRAPNTEGA